MTGPRSISHFMTVSAILALLALTGCASQSKRSLNPKEKARILVEMANGALLDNDPTGALIALADAEKIDDSLPELHHSRALAFMLKNDPKTALLHAQKAVDLKSDYSDACTTLGKLLLDEGRFDESEKFLSRAAYDPLNRYASRAQTNLGILFFKKGDLARARTQLDRAISGAPLQSCAAYFYRGQIHMKRGSLKDAMSDYDRASQKFCAGFGEADLAVADAYIKSRQYNLARKKLVEIQQRYSNTAYADQAMEKLRYIP